MPTPPIRRPPGSGSKRRPAPPTGVQRAVLSFTGAHSIQIAVFGLMLIALGVALGSVSAVARRRIRLTPRRGRAGC